MNTSDESSKAFYVIFDDLQAPYSERSFVFMLNSYTYVSYFINDVYWFIVNCVKDD